jgi:hypothetical protein
MTLIPAVAAALTQVVANNGNATQQILNMFDSGMCMNLGGGMAKAGDKVLDPCEVSQNNVLGPILTVDVQLFDNMGVFKPNPMNAQKDSWSLGIGFTAVEATY